MIRKIVGAIVIALGLSAAGVSIYAVIMGEFLGIPIAFAGVLIAIAGVALFSDEKISEIFKDLIVSLNF